MLRLTFSLSSLPPSLPPSLQTYEETLLQLWNYSRAQAIPYRSLQIDSWWYMKVGKEGGRERERGGGRTGAGHAHLSLDRGGTMELPYGMPVKTHSLRG